MAGTASDVVATLTSLSILLSDLNAALSSASAAAPALDNSDDSDFSLSEVSPDREGRASVAVFSLSCPQSQKSQERTALALALYFILDFSVLLFRLILAIELLLFLFSREAF